MSLVDETNREIPLSLEDGVTLHVDADHESTRKPAEDESAPNGVRYVKVADDLTSAEADQWVRGEKGQDA